MNAASGSYVFVDAHSAGSAQITDAELPALNWSGAALHIKNIRWSMLDRQVSASFGHSLTLNSGFSCLVSGWCGCQGWAYFLNNVIHTLDQDGEWYYDAARVSLNGNTLFGLKSNAWTLSAENLLNVNTSDDSRFFHPYQSEPITYAGYWPPHSLAEWQSASGKDPHSSTLWYTTLQAAIRSTEVSALGSYPVTVDDPTLGGPDRPALVPGGGAGLGCIRADSMRESVVL